MPGGQVSAGRYTQPAKAAWHTRSGTAGMACRHGHGDQGDQCLPKLIVLLQGKRVVQVSAGTQKSIGSASKEASLRSPLAFRSQQLIIAPAG